MTHSVSKLQRIKVYNNRELIHVIECCWQPDDMDQMVWELGGDSYEIEEVSKPSTLSDLQGIFQSRANATPLTEQSQ